MQRDYGSGYGREGGGDRYGGGGRGGGTNPNYFLPKPVKVGDEVEVTIDAIASKGDGIAKKDGFVIFVKDAKQGETVRVRITDVRARFAIGELIGAASSGPAETPSEATPQ
ncbi:MAG: TRAM domain-containing protein [Candidatus Micrarchaeaceae archaeon]